MDEDKCKTKEIEARIKALKSELHQLKSQMPAHSVKPGMLMRLEEIEDELERLKAEKIE
jgi:uncharacterized small protein (DUF1192 family)